MTDDARYRLQAAMSLLDEAQRQLRLTITGDANVRGIAYGEMTLAMVKAHSQIQQVLKDDEEEEAAE